jgi:hypothetical protein
LKPHNIIILLVNEPQKAVDEEKYIITGQFVSLSEQAAPNARKSHSQVQFVQSMVRDAEQQDMMKLFRLLPRVYTQMTET